MWFYSYMCIYMYNIISNAYFIYLFIYKYRSFEEKVITGKYPDLDRVALHRPKQVFFTNLYKNHMKMMMVDALEEFG